MILHDKVNHVTTLEMPTPIRTMVADETTTNREWAIIKEEVIIEETRTQEKEKHDVAGTAIELVIYVPIVTRGEGI